MNLNAEQQAAFLSMVEFATRNKSVATSDELDDLSFLTERQSPVFVLAGLAGTGKTTVIGTTIRKLVEDGFDAARIAVIAYTGKAASVLNKKLGAECPVTATTIHKFLYTTPVDGAAMLVKEIEGIESTLDAIEQGKEVPEGSSIESLRQRREDLMDELDTLNKRGKNLRFARQPPELLRKLYDLVIVDEASMVSDEIAEHLEDTGIAIIYAGDGNQLPPVKAAPGVDLRTPDAKLTTIMRQAGDSDIVTVAHRILKERKVPAITPDLIGVTRFSGSNPLPHCKDGIPQFICYFNKTRHGINHTIKKHVLGHPTDGEDFHVPQIGEMVMLDANIAAKRLMKGDLLKVKAIVKDDVTATGSWEALKSSIDEPTYRATMVLEDSYGTEHSMDVFLNDMMHSMKHPRAIPLDKTYEISRKQGDAVSIMYPYAMTCHKAQGSEWPRVAVINESNSRGDTVAYIYTAVTRASKELIVLG